MQIDGVSLHHRLTARLSGTVTQLFAGYNGEVWLATSNGACTASRRTTGSGRSPCTQPNSQLTIAQGALLVARRDIVRMLDLGYNRRARATTRLPGRAGGVGFAVLP
jgi:hypothetical protein